MKRKWKSLNKKKIKYDQISMKYEVDVKKLMVYYEMILNWFNQATAQLNVCDGLKWKMKIDCNEGKQKGLREEKQNGASSVFLCVVWTFVTYLIDMLIFITIFRNCVWRCGKMRFQQKKNAC